MLYPNLTVGPSDHLYFAGYDTLSLAADYGTPLVVMDESLVRSRCRTYRAALAEDLPAGSRPLYASKAFCCKRMCEIAREEGLGLDVVSSGELYTALLAGFPPEDIFYHGNNKTDADLAFAIGHGIGYIVCDNRYELEAIERRPRIRACGRRSCCSSPPASTRTPTRRSTPARGLQVRRRDRHPRRRRHHRRGAARAARRPARLHCHVGPSSSTARRCATRPRSWSPSLRAMSDATATGRSC
jgi:hypothetical protein